MTYAKGSNKKHEGQADGSSDASTNVLTRGEKSGYGDVCEIDRYSRARGGQRRELGATEQQS